MLLKCFFRRRAGRQRVERILEYVHMCSLCLSPSVHAWVLSCVRAYSGGPSGCRAVIWSTRCRRGTCTPHPLQPPHALVASAAVAAALLCRESSCSSQWCRRADVPSLTSITPGGPTHPGRGGRDQPVAKNQFCSPSKENNFLFGGRSCHSGLM